MRIANKNELLTLMQERVFYFSAFCISPEGTAVSFLFNNITNFDLDLPAIQNMFLQLQQGGILDEACIERFNTFNPNPEEQPLPQRVWIYVVPKGYKIPDYCPTYDDAAQPNFTWFSSTSEIVNDGIIREVSNYGIC
jgi:hypothetical protein